MKRRSISVVLFMTAVAVTACAPRLKPLTGVAATPERLPRSGAPAGRHKIVFNWEYEDREMTGRGEGAARISAPDSARLDFYLAGGFGSGAAILIGDSLQVPGGVDLARRLVPPPPLLWAALGRVALPNLPDTAIRVENGVLRADVGRPVAWRLSFRGDSLIRAERVEGGRIMEWMDRTDPTHVRYRNETARRTLQLTITRTDNVPEFDASIWHFDK